MSSSPTRGAHRVQRVVAHRRNDLFGGLDVADGGTTEVVVSGDAKGLLSSPLPVLECGLAAVGGCLAAAADLVEARTGRRPQVVLDAVHVAVALRSEGWLRHASGQGVEGFAPLSRLWPAADGWVRTHANYPWHRSALLGEFGVADGADAEVAPALGQVFASLSAATIEDRAFGARALAVAARTVEQWRATAAGSAVARTPLAEGTEASSGAPPLPARFGTFPATEIRVLDLTRVIAGPVGTRMLAALGADVLRVDAPDRPELSVLRVEGVVGKASTLIDAATPAGASLLDSLVGSADVVISGYRPGALRPLGLEADQIAERHPHVIVVNLSAWGSGPWHDRRGFDSLVQLASGIGWATSPDGEWPGALPCQLLDHATGYLLAGATLTALAERARTGRIMHVRLSLARTAEWLLQHDRGDRPAEPNSGPVEADAARFRVPFDGEWSGIAPPGTLDGLPLAWPHLPPRYGQDPPTWTSR